MIKRLFNYLTRRYWTIGFVINGLDGVMNDDPIHVEWLRTSKKFWFADPFILDVLDNEIKVLVEEMPVGKPHKGVITLLKVNRHSFEVIEKKILLELPTHLSFPCVLREKGKIYIYPESALSGRLDVYEYNPTKETVSYYKTICDDEVWDSCMTDMFGEKLLFTAAHNDYLLDIYKWDEYVNRFKPWKQFVSDSKNSRLGGQLFEYHGDVYYPAQDCNNGYGSALQIKKISYKDNDFSFETVKKIMSPHPKMKLGLHTMNEYKGVCVVDVLGYRNPLIGKTLSYIVGVIKKTKLK